MDYDRSEIAATYDAARGYDPAGLLWVLQFFLDNVPRERVSRIIDLGCGTGRFTYALAALFEADVVGLDPSQKMLVQARRKAADDRVSFHRAAGESLPLADGFADMVFLSMVFHHLKSPERVVREIRRVLRDGGHVCMRNSTADEVDSYAYLPFFPSIKSIILDQLPSRDRTTDLFATVGLARAAQATVAHRLAPNWRTFADKIALRADSFVARLAEAEFEAGLAALRRHAATVASDMAVEVNLDLFVFRRV